MNNCFTDLGFIIKQSRFGEADKFVKIFSKEHGLIEVIAKGARRQTSRKSTHLDNLNLIKFQVNNRPLGHYLTQIETINSFSHIKTNLRLTRTCFYILEIINQVIVFDQIDSPLFLSLKNYLEALEHGQENRQLNTKFQLYLIGHLGFDKPADTSPENLIRYFESLTNRNFSSLKIKL
jgi:DNA repair protein RecO (recombination protein O)